MRLEHGVKPLAHVPKGGEVLAIDDDQLGARLLGDGDLGQLPHAAGAGDVIARRQDPLLLDSYGEGLESRVLVLEHGCVKAVIVL